MIYYTFKASDDVVLNQFVQLSSDTNTVENHSTGTALGLCQSVYVSDDDGIRYAEVYAGGGGGRQALLNSDWDGSPSRFDVVNSKVQAVASGGIGWIIPSFPRTPQVANSLVNIAIY